jgi:hypothetical protein
VSGQTETLTAVVSLAAASTQTASGSVVFSDGVTVLGTVKLSKGTARLTVKNLTVGSHNFAASYTGSTTLLGSTANLAQQVNPALTTVLLTASNGHPLHGTTIVFAAQVKPRSPGSGVATGTVTFTDGGLVISVVSLSSGVATYATSTLSVGVHTIIATYSGSPSLTGSSGQIRVTIKP